jgi:hypothetical protein
MKNKKYNYEAFYRRYKLNNIGYEL